MRRAEQAQAGAPRWLSGLTALIVASMTAWVPAGAQESQAPAERGGAQRGTVLNAGFEKLLGDLELNWPTEETIARGEERDTRDARDDACCWQDLVLTKWFTAVGYKGGGARGEKGSAFTAGISAGGFDSIYHRWESDDGDYALQFRCTRDVFSVMVEPIEAAVRATLSEREVRERTADAVARIVTWGEELLRNSAMKLEPAPYGYFVFFNQTVEQFDALQRYRIVRDRHLAIAWLLQLTIRTDGYSFVFDFPKAAFGPTVIDLPVATRPTNQPRVKTWFKECKPRERPSP